MMLAGKLKRFAKDSFIYGIGDGLGKLISLVMLPILSRAFVPADYGAIDLLSVGYAFLLSGVSLSTAPGINRTYYKLEQQQQKTLVTSTTFFLVILASSVSIALFLFSSLLSELIIHSEELVFPIRVLALCLPIDLIFNILQLLLRIQRKAILFTGTNIARVIISPALTFYMVIIVDAGIIGVFYSKLISLTLLTTTTLFLERKQFGTTISFDAFRKLVAFTLPAYPGVMIRQCMDILPRTILATFAPLSAVGLFGIASRVSKLINLYLMAFNRSWGPFAFTHADKPEEKKLYEIIFKTFAFSLILLGLVLSLFAGEVITVLTPSQYHSAHHMVAGIVFYQGMRGLTQIFGTALYVAKKAKWLSYLNILQLCVFLIGAFILVPRYHSFGLIAAMDIAIVVFFLCYMQVTLKYFTFPIPKLRLGVLLAVAVVSIILLNMFAGAFLVKIMIKISFIVCFAGIGAFFLLTPDERQKVKQLAGAFPASEES